MIKDVGSRLPPWMPVKMAKRWNNFESTYVKGMDRSIESSSSLKTHTLSISNYFDSVWMMESDLRKDVGYRLPPWKLVKMANRWDNFESTYVKGMDGSVESSRALKTHTPSL